MKVFSSVLFLAAVALGVAEAAHPLAARHPSSGYSFGGGKTSTPSCTSSQFYYGEKDCCLEKGGPPKAPTPPKGVGCPDEWYFHTEQSCCVPKQPLPTPQPSKPKPTPSCPQKGWLWNLSLQCCSAPPTTTHTTSTHHPSPTPKKGGYYMERKF